MPDARMTDVCTLNRGGTASEARCRLVLPGKPGDAPFSPRVAQNWQVQFPLGTDVKASDVVSVRGEKLRVHYVGEDARSGVLEALAAEQ